MAAKIFLVTALIFVAGIVLYLFQSGVFGHISFPGSNSSSSEAGAVSSTKESSYNKSLNPRNFVPQSWLDFVASQRMGISGSAPQSSDQLPPSSPGASTGTQSVIKPADIPKGFTINQVSPYWRKVKFSFISRGSVNSYDRISLSTSLNQNETIDMAGWYIQARKGTLRIPKAFAVYNPYSNSASDIVLKYGDSVKIYSNKGVMGNFRLNKCTGYFNESFTFVPSLPNSCPKIYDSRSDIFDFTPRCQDFISSIGTCRLPNLNQYWLPGDSQCRVFLEKVNYQGCYQKHIGDADFLGKEWWVWADQRFLDSDHDRVWLFDNTGKLVDEYYY